MGNQVSQMFPPTPAFTESALPAGSLKDKVFIVTGASTGVGKELARLLYSLHGTVYIAARSKERSDAAMAWIREAHPDSKGRLEFVYVELADLESIKPAAEEFLAKEKRLDILFNNAGVMVPPQGSKTKQGYELQLGTNCLGHYAFTKLLTPLLVQTAKVSEAGSVRVVWVSSSAVVSAPKGGVNMDNLDYRKDKLAVHKYGVSKAGNVLHALAFRNLHEKDGVLSVSLNPGNLSSELTRHAGLLGAIVVKLITYPPVNGAYTELFAGLAPEVKALKRNEWVIPFGRITALRADLAEAGEEGGKAQKFWDWSDEQVAKYL
ncbi:NAD(P)-binding protein [Didymella exigua CBS 183.55]|uniref:NAD(P)-binding protein n=1 Tax=Didymella exigua CBS 183.55 TaxID=1150837 RepID=A0A6A5RYL7_9PLEO|nr:NAD(P)-binding protein [Didymella exigua CBS 183.55]KAF1930347.1 NAD(P)-binding protein [Didymella exigua CBS 183.55]